MTTNPISPSDLTEERGKTHGSFADHARITLRLKELMQYEMTARQIRSQPPLTDQHRESLDMIAHKIGRIIAGDPTFQDHWDDIAGYAHIANKKFE